MLYPRGISPTTSMWYFSGRCRGPEIAVATTTCNRNMDQKSLVCHTEVLQARKGAGTFSRLADYIKRQAHNQISNYPSYTNFKLLFLASQCRSILGAFTPEYFSPYFSRLVSLDSAWNFAFTPKRELSSENFYPLFRCAAVPAREVRLAWGEKSTNFWLAGRIANHAP